jgi:hypothetical protein
MRNCNYGVGFFGFLLFAPSSHCFPIKFPMGSQVLNVFLSVLPIASDFVPYALPNIVLFEPW